MKKKELKPKKHKEIVNIRKFKKIKEKSSKIKERLCEFLELPYELIGDTAKITLVDDKYVYIEGKCSVTDYYSDCIKLNMSKFITSIEGNNMTIRELSNYEIVIDGNIRGVSYENK